MTTASMRENVPGRHMAIHLGIHVCSEKKRRAKHFEDHRTQKLGCSYYLETVHGYKCGLRKKWILDWSHIQSHLQVRRPSQSFNKVNTFDN